jgi:hypothetical protein
MRQLFIDFKKAYDSIKRGILYNWLIKFGIPMKLVTQMKMCLNETYGTVCVGKHLSDMFPIKNGLKKEDALLPLFSNFSLKYAVRRVYINQGYWKLNGTHQHLIYVNILGGSIHTIKKNTDALVVACKETGLEVNDDTTKYMVISLDQNVGQSHNIKIDNISFERLEQFKYLGTTLTNHSSIQEDIMSSLNSGNVCYHSVQNLLPSILLSTHIKIKIHRTVILPVVLYGCEAWCLTLNEECRLRVFEDSRVLRKIFGPKWDG